MTDLHASIRHIPMPPRMRALPVLESGWPQLWFADTNPETGKPDLRIMDHRKLARAIKERRCWLCGQPLGVYRAFVLGPMCCVTRTTSEPPCHYDCAAYAVKACPFLTRPHVHRSEAHIPADASMAGVGLKRNPGVAAIWITRSYKAWSPDTGGVLITVGDPKRVEWWAEGRAATREEVEASIESGMPFLREQADLDKDREGAHRDLDKKAALARELLP